MGFYITKWVLYNKMHQIYMGFNITKWVLYNKMHQIERVDDGNVDDWGF